MRFSAKLWLTNDTYQCAKAESHVADISGNSSRRPGAWRGTAEGAAAANANATPEPEVITLK